MSKKPFEPRGLNEIGYSSIGCLAQYLYEYFWQEGHRLGRSASKTREQVQAQAAKITEELTERRVLESRLIDHLEDMLFDIQAQEWLAKLFKDFSNGINPLEEEYPIDFNDVYSSKVLPQISGLLRAIRSDIERQVKESMQTEFLKPESKHIGGSSGATAMIQVKQSLARARILARFENEWNYLHTAVADSLENRLRKLKAD